MKEKDCGEKKITVLFLINDTHTYGLTRWCDSLKEQEVKKEVKLCSLTLRDILRKTGS